jgi:hypothetical protein
MGTSRFKISSTAYRSEVPETNLPFVAQGLQIGGTSALIFVKINPLDKYCPAVFGRYFKELF